MRRAIFLTVVIVPSAILGLALTSIGTCSAQTESHSRQLSVWAPYGAQARAHFGPAARHLSSAWQNLFVLAVAMRQLEQMNPASVTSPPDIAAARAPMAAAASYAAASRSPVSRPPTLGSSRFSYFTTNETSTAWCGSNVVVGFNDTGSLTETVSSEGASVIGYAHSTDAGVSYSDDGTPPPMSEPLSLLAGDPVLGCSNASIFYYASLWNLCNTVSSGTCISGTNGVSVATSSNGGATFGPPVPAISKDITTHMIDKDWMAVVAGNPDHLYVTYTDFDTSNPNDCGAGLKRVAIEMVTSANDGQTWSSPVEIQKTCDGHTVVQGSQVVVGPSGEVWVAWEQADGATREIDIAGSVNNGASFNTPARVTSVHCAGDCFELQGFIRSSESPSLAVNAKGKLLLVWNDGTKQVADSLALLTSGGVSTSYGFTDVLFVTSVDGVNWTPPVRVNDDPENGVSNPYTDQFEPALAVVPGHIVVCFYDRRNDPLNFLIDRYCAVSTNGGQTWINTQVTPHGFPSLIAQDYLLASDYMGDYDSVAVDALKLNPGFIESFANNLPGHPAVKANRF